jgi:hypothetical protein
LKMVNLLCLELCVVLLNRNYAAQIEYFPEGRGIYGVSIRWDQANARVLDVWVRVYRIKIRYNIAEEIMSRLGTSCHIRRSGPTWTNSGTWAWYRGWLRRAGIYWLISVIDRWSYRGAGKRTATHRLRESE